MNWAAGVLLPAWDKNWGEEEEVPCFKPIFGPRAGMLRRETANLEVLFIRNTDFLPLGWLSCGFSGG